MNTRKLIKGRKRRKFLSLLHSSLLQCRPGDFVQFQQSRKQTLNSLDPFPCVSYTLISNSFLNNKILLHNRGIFCAASHLKIQNNTEQHSKLNEFALVFFCVEGE